MSVLSQDGGKNEQAETRKLEKYKYWRFTELD